MPSSAVHRLDGLLCQNLRVTVKDGRIFIGSFAGTDQPLNILLLNADEFRLGPDEDPDGRYVGQVLIPWKLVVKVEAQNSSATHIALSDYI
ncbi:N-alpha-acetyltransferase 38-A, NatC auxiliary subunit [Favolaschia claudopus]|uniref:N-alpha-acetyltransferase 38-A, NatC auxiliary subunit n=1 Tax=Favolaschia claudopus TaxID=2862362 RepID=A0AAW0DL06_9AGAR